jgi:5'-3' exonuclease
MKTYLLIDLANLFFRAKHVVRGETPEELAGMCIHVTLKSLRKVWKKFNADHMVICKEGDSWRKAVYPRYKANRVHDKPSTPKEVAEQEALYAAFQDLKSLLDEHTNVSVLQHPLAEADDLIARWIAVHPDANHIICSSDSDFVQLISDRVTLYNGVRDITITPSGVFDSRDRPLNFSVENSGKVKVSKQLLGKGDVFPERPDWIEYALFTKILRGDSGDNIFTACEPRTRQKGTKSKVGILECFKDRETKGYDWFNFMNHRWTNHQDKEHIVRDLFEENKMLIDLNAMPDEVKDEFDRYILNYEKAVASQLGFYFLRFASKYELEDIAKDPRDFVEMLNARI